MVNVDPLVLVAAGTAVVGIATIAVCALQAPRKSESRRSKRDAPAQHSHVPSSSSSAAPIVESAPAAKKGKKKVRSNKKKKSGNMSESPVPEEESQSEVEAVKPVSKEHNAPELDASFNADDEDEEEDLRILSNRGNTFFSVNKPKKAKETPEQKAARVERQKMKDAKRAAMEERAAAAAAKLEAEAQSLSEFNNVGTAPDGWAVVEVKKSKTKLEAEATAAESENTAPVTPVPEVEKEVPAVPAAPVVETVTQPMTVDSRKIGLLIGPKGVTKIGIQVATGATIEMPKVDKDAPATTAIVNVTGTADAVARAVHALNELCTKGYSTLLAPDDFQEGYVAIHPRFLPDVIGKGGVCIRALQQHTGVKITTPTIPRDGSAIPSKIKINLAGPREKVTEARNLIKEITKYYHTPVTHPGMVHSELDVPAHYYNYIIGAKGSEIKHIQANFKVNVYIPNAESNNSNVLIVGEPANVANAEKHIHKLIEKVNAIQEQKAAAEAVAEAYREASKAARQAAAAAAAANNASSIAPVVGYSVGGGGKPSTARVDKDDEPKEEWMKEFERRGDGIDFSHLLPAKAKFAAAAPAPVTETAASTAAAPVEDAPAEGVAAEGEGEPKSTWGAAVAATSAETTTA